MSLSILNNTTALYAQNQINQTQQSLQRTLLQLSSGSRINSGADDAAGLAIADGLHANISALTQSARNASDGVGMLQVADGALSQVTNLLNRAVTLATEASNGTVTDNQRVALDNEFKAIKDEITAIGQKTTYNGSAVFAGGSSTDPNDFQGTTPVGVTTAFGTDTDTLQITDSSTGKSYTFTSGTQKVSDLIAGINAAASAGEIHAHATINATTGQFEIQDTSGGGALTIVQNGLAELGTVDHATTNANSELILSDGTGTGTQTITTTLAAFTAAAVGFSGGTPVDLTADDLTSATDAKGALTDITKAIAQIAADRGSLGATINQLTAASNVETVQMQNLTTAEDGIRSADVAQTVADMTKYNILSQTGISALAQANQMQQGVLKLLQ